MPSLRPSRRENFEIAIICALPLEYDAVSLVFDEFWDEDGDEYGRAPGDYNHYAAGRIGKHNVVLTLLSHMGKAYAAGAAASVRSSYVGLRLALLVGICGGVPRTGLGDDGEVLLGDVVIGKSIVQHDLGRQHPDKFVRKDTLEDNLSMPAMNVRNLLVTFETYRGRERLQQRTAYFLEQLQTNADRRKQGEIYNYPGTTEDKLMPLDYCHKHRGGPVCIYRDCNDNSNPVCEETLNSTCDTLRCDENQLVPRECLKAKQLGAHKPCIHIGAIASGDAVMKSGEDRDRIAKKERVIAFEMEGAGVWEQVPCIVVKGVCDYADSDKNKKWQHFAAVTAASASKAILERYTQTDSALLDPEGSLHGSVTQGGSKYKSDATGNDITQGNVLEISKRSARDCVQEGSDFEGKIHAEHSISQGNVMRI